MSVPHRKRATRIAPVFAALGDSNRLELISRLADGQAQSIAQLSDGLRITRQGVSKHLSVLESARIVSSRRVGRESQFSLRQDTLNDARHYLERASQQWDEAVGRLKKLVEE